MLCATGLLPSSFYVISFVLLWAMMCVASRVHPWNCFLQHHSQCCLLFGLLGKYQRCVHSCNPCDQHWALHKALCYTPTLEITSRSIFLNIQAMLPIGSYFHPRFSCPPVCLHTYYQACTLKIGVPTPQQFIRSWFSISLSSHSLKSKAESLAERI